MAPPTDVFDVGRQRFSIPPIRGRVAELETIGSMVTAVAAGQGGVLVIEGPPGIGKSRLLTEVVRLAEKAGLRTLFGEAFEYQQTVPFFSLFMATLNASPPVGDGDALRQLGSSADLHYWVVHDLADAIRAAAAESPLVIVLEDVHWADNSTALALLSLARVSPDVPVLWVLTARTGAGGPAMQATLSALRHDDATFLRLAAITPDAVAAMIQDAIRTKADASLLNLAAKAHGNPFLVTEMVRGLGEEGRLDFSHGRAVANGQGLPRRLGASMQQRLDLLTTDASEVVRVAAVLPDRFSAALLAEMLERSPTSLLSALNEAVRADLFVEDGEHLRFRHDLLREATRQSLPQSLRRAMERQSASVMLRMGAAPAEVAMQLARSAEPGDREAIEALTRAAQSVGHNDAGAAADLSKRALELMAAHTPDHGPLVADTVEWLNRAGRHGEAEELAVAALSAAATPEEEAEIRLRLPAHTRHSTQQRVAENRRALELSNISEVTRARHLAWLAYNVAMQDKAGQLRSAAVDAGDAAARTGDPEATILSGIAFALVDVGEGHRIRALARLDELCSLAYPNDAALAHRYAAMHRAILLTVVGRLDEATTHIADGKAQATREGNAMVHDMWAILSAIVHLVAGRLSAARELAEPLPLPQPTGASEPDLLRIVVMASVAIRTDDRNLLQQMIDNARDAYSSGSPAIRRGAAYVLALAAWQRENVHEAVRWLGGDIVLLGTPLQSYALDRLIFSARVASAAGDAGLRARVLEAVELLDRERPAVPLLAAVAGHARAVLERDADALVAVAAALRASPRPLLYAGAAEDAGTHLVDAQRTPEALDHLNAAFDTYVACGATADARRVGRALRQLGTERRITQPRARTGWDSLTDAELTVVNLIAQGATNRAVADQLHLSPHTVKTHVRNAFAKLDITSRTQLKQFAHRTD